MLLAGDGDGDFVEVPDIISTGPFAAQAPSVVQPELLSPPTDRLVGNDDAALQQHFFDMTQAQRKSIIQPHRVGDDLGWEPMPFVADLRSVHPPHLSQRSLTSGYRDNDSKYKGDVGFNAALRRSGGVSKVSHLAMLRRP